MEETASLPFLETNTAFWIYKVLVTPVLFALIDKYIQSTDYVFVKFSIRIEL